MGNRIGRFTRLALALFLGLGLARSAMAEAVWDFDFVAINGKYQSDRDIAERQLKMRMSEASVGNTRYLDFKFWNTGPDACSITDIYFDDGTDRVLKSITGMWDSGDGVAFTKDGPGKDKVAPGNLPGGNLLTPSFQVTTGLSADSDAPAQPNGINPGEWLTIRFELMPGRTFWDALKQMPMTRDEVMTPVPLSDVDLRVGIHVQGFASGESLSMIAVPLPPAVWGGFALLGALGAKRLRRGGGDATAV